MKALQTGTYASVEYISRRGFKVQKPNKFNMVCYAEHHSKQRLASVFGFVSGLQRPQLELCARVSSHCGVDATVRVCLALLEQCT